MSQQSSRQARKIDAAETVRGRIRRVAPAFGLFLLAPFVGEFLLGNLTINELGLGIVLAPLYGCGALLVRELARRAGRGWPTMALLAAAYALVEEGPVDQPLWNDSYANHDLLHGDSYIPVLGMNVELTQTILALHTIWSICVPIAIIETLVPDRRTTPWLRAPGLVATAGLAALVGTSVYWARWSWSPRVGTNGPAWWPGASWGWRALIALLILLLAARVAACRPARNRCPVRRSS